LTAGDVDAAVALACAYADAKNYARAEQVLRDALTTSPDSADLLANLARIQVLVEDYPSAASTAYAALAIAPEYGFAMRMYAIALEGIGRLGDALQVAWRGATSNPHDRLAHYVYAELLLKARRPWDALYVVGEVLRLEPANTDSHVLHGQVLARLGRHQESTAAYEEALRLDPSNAAAVHNIAVNRLGRNRWLTALRGFRGAARLDPHLGDLVRRNISVALSRLLRLSTAFAAAVAFFVVLSSDATLHRESSATGLRITVGVVSVALLGYMVWVSRVVPIRTWRSVLAKRSVLVLRIILAICAIAVGTLTVAGGEANVTSGLGSFLLFGVFGVSVIGWLARE
jgi:tetratricopeptide (TPR) repeat protein